MASCTTAWCSSSWPVPFYHLASGCCTRSSTLDSSSILTSLLSSLVLVTCRLQRPSTMYLGSSFASCSTMSFVVATSAGGQSITVSRALFFFEPLGTHPDTLDMIRRAFGWFGRRLCNWPDHHLLCSSVPEERNHWPPQHPTMVGQPRLHPHRRLRRRREQSSCER